MPDVAEKIALTIVRSLPRGKIAKRQTNELVAIIRPTIEKLIGEPILPQHGETIAASASVADYKIAALFFDRVWSFPGAGSIPDDVVVYGATATEATSRVLSALLRADDDIEPDDVAVVKRTSEFLRNAINDRLGSLDLGPTWNSLSSVARIGRILYLEKGLQITPIYDSGAARDVEYLPGETQAIVAAVSDLKVVDPRSLSWEQVQEFRKDNTAKIKLRRMRRWLDVDMKGSSVAQLTDAIASRLDDYEWSIRKHGLQTLTGTMSELLDPKLLSATSATMAGLAYSEGAIWAALGGAGIMVGRAAVSLVEKMVDLKDRKRDQGAEVAFVHEIKKLAKK